MVRVVWSVRRAWSKRPDVGPWHLVREDGTATLCGLTLQFRWAMGRPQDVRESEFRMRSHCKRCAKAGGLDGS